MSRKPITPHDVEKKAHELAGNILEEFSDEKDKQQMLIKAIEALHGGLENFYEEFYQYLDEKQKKELGAMIDKIVEEKKKKKQRFAELLSSGILEEVLEVLRMTGIGEAQHVDPSQAFSPAHQATTSSSRKGKSKKGDRER